MYQTDKPGITTATIGSVNLLGPNMRKQMKELAQTLNTLSRQIEELCGEENKGAPLLREETRGYQMMQGNTEPIEPLCIKKDGKLYANGAPILSGEKSETNPQ